jgi:hypothetical protein
MTGPPTSQKGSVTFAGSSGGTHDIKTVPENPPTDVNVYGIVPTPFGGMVVLLALSVKVGVCAQAKAAKRRKAVRHAETVSFAMERPLWQISPQ